MLAVTVCSLVTVVLLVGLIAFTVAGIVAARGAIGDALAFDPATVRPWSPAGRPRLA